MSWKATSIITEIRNKADIRTVVEDEKMSKICILKGSPRKNGNTNTLLQPFVEEMEKQGHQCEMFDLHDMDINPCIACRNCQDDQTIFGCVHKDDMQKIFDSILESELIVLASPIYSWYCTPPMKMVLDRLVYGMNKFYGEQEEKPALWVGKKVAILTTCGYRPDKGADLFEEGIKRYCKHSQLKYCGMLVERHMGYNTEFFDDEKAQHAAQFAVELAEQI